MIATAVGVSGTSERSLAVVLSRASTIVQAGDQHARGRVLVHDRRRMDDRLGGIRDG